MKVAEECHHYSLWILIVSLNSMYVPVLSWAGWQYDDNIEKFVDL